MKNIVLYFVIVAALFGCANLLPTQILPYSMVKFQPLKFVDNTEITVEQYAEFIYDGNAAHKPQEQIAKQFKYYEVFYPNAPQDSLYKAYGKIGYYKLPVVKEYFDTLNYGELREILDFPVSGIRFEDAQAYCKWRTKRYAENTTHTKQTIRFELPDSVVLPPLDTLYKKNKWDRDIPQVNFKELKYQVKRDAPNKKVYTTIGVAPVTTKTAKQNIHGVYDFYGNVAEMSLHKGKAYGGSYNNTVEELQNITYNKPEPWLGFRCVGIITE